MRIIAGVFRSRPIKSVAGDRTRPTTDKVKEALFNTIGPYFDGGNWLDLFAGSGSVGIEAISRGAAQAVFVDSARDAISTIAHNCRILGLTEDRITIIRADHKQALNRLAGQWLFDYIYIDPPYRRGLAEAALNDPHIHEVLVPGGQIIVESAKESTYLPAYGDIIKTKEVVYGISKLIYFKKKEEER